MEAEIDCKNRLRETDLSRIQPLFAAFADPFPSLSPEIYCKLQYKFSWADALSIFYRHECHEQCRF